MLAAFGGEQGSSVQVVEPATPAAASAAAAGSRQQLGGSEGQEPQAVDATEAAAAAGAGALLPSQPACLDAPMHLMRVRSIPRWAAQPHTGSQPLALAAPC